MKEIINNSLICPYLTLSLFPGDQNAMAEKASMWLFYKLNVFMNENTIFAILTEKHRLFFIVMVVKSLYLIIRLVCWLISWLGVFLVYLPLSLTSAFFHPNLVGLIGSSTVVMTVTVQRGCFLSCLASISASLSIVRWSSSMLSLSNVPNYNITKLISALDFV